MKYSVGDRVKFKAGNGGYENIENEGTIRNIGNGFYMIECTYVQPLSFFNQTLAFSEKEIEDYA